MKISGVSELLMGQTTFEGFWMPEIVWKWYSIDSRDWWWSMWSVCHKTKFLKRFWILKPYKFSCYISDTLTLTFLITLKLQRYESNFWSNNQNQVSNKKHRLDVIDSFTLGCHQKVNKKVKSKFINISFFNKPNDQVLMN